jgi:pyruvate dehydrogenase (quinone)
MSQTVGDFILNRLHDWGVRRIFGYPGDGINGLLAALGRQIENDPKRLEFVQVRHEEEAAFMASGHARFTGEVGVCLATSGPGAIHLLNGLYDAKMDRKPVVAIVGQTPRAALGGSYQQEVDLPALLKDVAGEFVQTCTTPAQARHLIDRAVRTAAARRCVTAIIIPNDVQEAEAVDTQAHAHGTVHSSAAYSEPSIVPRDEDLARAADILNRGERVAMLVGAGALGASQEVIDVANRLQAGVAKALLGKSVLSDDLPFVTGQIGLLGTKASFQLMSQCDTLLMVGSTFPYSEYLPKEGQARGVQIDIDPTMLGLRYPVESALVGDAATTLRALLERLQPKRPSSWRPRVEDAARAWWNEEEQRAHLEAAPLNPERFFWELSSQLPPEAMLSVDTGMSTIFFARAIRARQGMPVAISGSLATMGPALSYATAGKFAFPQRPAIALVGDGAMQMLGINGLITVAKYWRKWADPRFIVAVLNNGDLNMVSWELRALGGAPKLRETQDVPSFDYAAYARLLGLEGLVVDDPEKVASTIAEAMRCQRPVVIDVRADPNVIALPPHATMEQTKNFFTAMANGDPDRHEILKQLAKQLVL